MGNLCCCNRENELQRVLDNTDGIDIINLRESSTSVDT